MWYTLIWKIRSNQDGGLTMSNTSVCIALEIIKKESKKRAIGPG